MEFISKEVIDKSSELFADYLSALRYSNAPEIEKINEKILPLAEARLKALTLWDQTKAMSLKTEIDILNGKKINLNIDYSIRRELARDSVWRHNKAPLKALNARLERLWQFIEEKKTFELLSEEVSEAFFQKIYRVKTNIIPILSAQLQVAEAFEKIRDTITPISEAVTSVDSVYNQRRSFDTPEIFRLIELEFQSFRATFSNSALGTKKEGYQILSSRAISSIIANLEGLKIKDRLIFKTA